MHTNATISLRDSTLSNTILNIFSFINVSPFLFIYPFFRFFFRHSLFSAHQISRLNVVL